MTPTQQILDLFKPLIGQLAWGIDQGYGTILSLEFGKPHLEIREPIVARPGTLAKVARHLKRRRVHITGDWHFSVLYSDWKISVGDRSYDSREANSSPNECLDDLDGQRLVSVASGALPHSWRFKFDLGAALEVWPSTTIVDNVWTLHPWNGDIAVLRYDGTLAFEKAEPRGED